MMVRQAGEKYTLELSFARLICVIDIRKVD